MTTKPKAKDDEGTAEATTRQATPAEATPLCGIPHALPQLSHVTCQQPAPDPDRAPGTPDHQHRWQDGDLIYVW